jgi:predicted transcriptional regulator of viral defense system
MERARTYRDVVREIARDHYGYVTTREAAEAGVPPAELPKLASRGGLENVAYGLYRVVDTPTTPLDQYAEALLRAGDGAFLHGESVLALHGLADVNPRRIHVAVRRRTRPRLPPLVELTLVLGEVPTTFHEGLLTQRVGAAIEECRGRIEPSRLVQATEQARDRGLITTTEWNDLQEEITP